MLADVDDAADGVQDAPRQEQAHDRRPACDPELGQEPERYPAEGHVQHGGQPARGAPPHQALDDAQHRPAPHDAQHERGGPAAQQGHRQGRVGAGDQQEDVGVVEGLEGDGDAARQAAAGDVIRTGVGEEQQGRDQVGGARPGQGGAGGQDGQHDARGHGQGRDARMDPAAQVRLGVPVVGQRGLPARGALHGGLLDGTGVIRCTDSLVHRSLDAHQRTSLRSAHVTRDNNLRYRRLRCRRFGWKGGKRLTRATVAPGLAGVSAWGTTVPGEE